MEFFRKKRTVLNRDVLETILSGATSQVLIDRVVIEHGAGRDRGEYCPPHDLLTSFDAQGTQEFPRPRLLEIAVQFVTACALHRFKDENADREDALGPMDHLMLHEYKRATYRNSVHKDERLTIESVGPVELEVGDIRLVVTDTLELTMGSRKVATINNLSLLVQTSDILRGPDV